jgi:tight adherence protein B
MNRMSSVLGRVAGAAGIVVLSLLGPVQAPAAGAAVLAPDATAAAAAATAQKSLVIAIDNSPRITPIRFNAAKDAARALLEGLSDVQVGLIAIGGQATIVESFGSTQAAIAELAALKQTPVDFAGEEIDSQLTQGISLAVETLRTATGPRGMILLTDGTNSGSAVPIEQARQSAIEQSINIGIIDMRSTGDTDPARNAIITELRGVKGEAVSANDAAGLARLAQSIFTPRDIPSQLPMVPETSLAARILGSNVTLGFGALAIGGAIFFSVMQVMGPKEVKVNLTGIPLPQKKKQEVKTPVAGLALKLSDIADERLEKSGKARGMQSWLERGAVNLRSGEFFMIVVFATIATAAITYQINGPAIGLLMLVLTPLIARFVVNRRAKKRSTKFGDQLSDTLQLLSSSMRAGQGFMQALDAVAKESDSPTSEEFHRVVVETRLGRDLVDSLKAMTARIECEDMEWVIPAVEINREVGGDLAEVLEQVGATIRDRADLRRQVKTLSAEGRLSAFVLVGLPIVLGGFIQSSNPEYMGALFEGFGLYLVGAASLMMLIGSIWLFNLCKIEF